MIIDLLLQGFEAPGLSFERRSAANTIINQIKGKPVPFNVSEDDVIDTAKLYTAAFEKVDNNIKGALTPFRIRKANKAVNTALTKTYKDAAIVNGTVLIIDVLVQ